MEYKTFSVDKINLIINFKRNDIDNTFLDCWKEDIYLKNESKINNFPRTLTIKNHKWRIEGNAYFVGEFSLKRNYVYRQKVYEIDIIVNESFTSNDQIDLLTTISK